MVDKYKYDPEGVSAIATTLKGQINDYTDKITELKSLINQIEGSSSWKDASVKASFIATSQAYIELYTKLERAMTKYVNYLEGKASSAQELEQAFTRS